MQKICILDISKYCNQFGISAKFAPDLVDSSLTNLLNFNSLQYHLWAFFMAELFSVREVLCTVKIKTTPSSGGFLLHDVHATELIM